MPKMYRVLNVVQMGQILAAYLFNDSAFWLNLLLLVRHLAESMYHAINKLTDTNVLAR